MADNGESRNRKLFLGVVALQLIGGMSEGANSKILYALLVAAVAVFCIVTQFIIDRKKNGKQGTKEETRTDV